jgi:hypothetical protein
MDYAIRTNSFATRAPLLNERSSSARTVPASIGRPAGVLTNFLGFIGLALMTPLFVLLLPLALLYRAVLEAAGWPTWLPRVD